MGELRPVRDATHLSRLGSAGHKSDLHDPFALYPWPAD